jgi:hypothetical protein
MKQEVFRNKTGVFQDETGGVWVALELLRVCAGRVGFDYDPELQL